MNISTLTKKDFPKAQSLIIEVFMEFESPDYTEQGVSTFREFLYNENIVSSLEIFGAFRDNELIGVIATRNKNHISMLFVKKEFHRKGVARALCEHVFALTDNQIITVNSSPYAVGFYQKLNFTATDDEKNIDGIRFYPMHKIR